MAEILINAEEVRSCVKYKSGKVCIWLDGVKDIRELPPHGELCDKDKLKEATKNTEIRNSRGEIYPIGKAIAKMIDEVPTVLGASK